MNKRHWNLVKEVVDTALTYSGKERDTYLNTVFEETPHIADEVKQMLLLIEESQQAHFMQSVRRDGEKLISELGSDESEERIGENLIGRKIGRYLVTDLIDVGGMGMVFKARRADGEFSQDVAVKLLKKGLDTEENIHRFKIEREILSSLNHPNIAQIYDGGITNDGLPYLVMEFIEGSPIDEYCNANSLTVNERISLFRQICQTVDYAHKNLVIHRDLKAPNIFVSANGNVKILDFGIAKLLDRTHPDIDLLETLPGRKIWTPQYASPEQVKGDTVTTSTDVYALGVLLHYLLTDTYPIDLKDRPIHVVEQRILNDEPVAPSRCISNSPDLSKIASNRSATASSIIDVLKTDLDYLILKTLRKEPGDRYNSVSQLIEELDRFESGQPLMAKSGSVRYRVGKFIKRHRTRLAAAAVFLISLIALSLIYTWNITQERNIAQLEREKAEQVADFLTSLFSAGNPVNAQGEMLTAVDLLDMGIERVEDLSEQPLVQAEMLYTIGSSYRGMQMPDKAVPLLEKALNLQRNHLPSDHPDIAFTLNALGSVHWSVDKDLIAEPYLREALEIRKRVHGSQHPDVFTSLNNYALVLLDMGQLDEAEEIHRENLEARKAYYGPVHSKVNFTLNNLAYLLAKRGKLEEAELYYREGLNAGRMLLGDNHSDVAIFLSNLARLLQRQGKFDQAEELIIESIRIREKVYGENHSRVARALNVLATIHRKKGDYESAEKVALRSYRIVSESFDEDHTTIAQGLSILGMIYRDKGELEKAELYLSESLQMHLRVYPEGHIHLAESYNTNGEFYLSIGQPENAVPLFTEALTMFKNVSPSGLFTIATVQHQLGKALLETKQFPEAETHLLDAYSHFNKNEGISDRHKRNTLQQLISLYRDWDKHESAERFEDELVLIQQTDTE
ncbi:serine/threonine-protein kinase [Rhodohalobacter mucosus]|uniref:Protein kinase domain-containing protein n=1 Tax=Rhodohalobacter mucosus TaxID=2079485 RepID=A0A316TS97_9BACT|nr:serine/threonine-protein kinase [Rhodohalobacter mucosus]PWN06511.1 hypothetical protein DDZ15_08290 [Rhodohalobacter mucosus]